MYEIELAIFHANNIFVGPDGILSSAIEKAWPVYKKEITCLF